MNNSHQHGLTFQSVREPGPVIKNGAGRRKGRLLFQVWQTDVKGGQFFFYSSSEPAVRVVWLTIEGSGSTSLLETAVKIF